MDKEEFDSIAEMLAQNPDVLRRLIANMSVEAVRWRTALEECQRLAMESLDGFEEKLPDVMGDIERTAREALTKENSE